MPQVDRWSRQYKASIGERGLPPDPAMLTLATWLHSHIPPEDAGPTVVHKGIVHGDFRLDNLIFHPTQVLPLPPSPCTSPFSPLPRASPSPTWWRCWTGSCPLWATSFQTPPIAACPTTSPRELTLSLLSPLPCPKASPPNPLFWPTTVLPWWAPLHLPAPPSHRHRSPLLCVVVGGSSPPLGPPPPGPSTWPCPSSAVQPSMLAFTSASSR